MGDCPNQYDPSDGCLTADSDVLLLAPAITAAGIDFIQDDSGLTTILGVLTVRLEAVTLRALLLLIACTGMPITGEPTGLGLFDGVLIKPLNVDRLITLVERV